MKKSRRNLNAAQHIRVCAYLVSIATGKELTSEVFEFSSPPPDRKLFNTISWSNWYKNAMSKPGYNAATVTLITVERR